MSKEGRNADGTFSKGHIPLRKKVSWQRTYNIRSRTMDTVEKLQEKETREGLDDKERKYLASLLPHVLPSLKIAEPMNIPNHDKFDLNKLSGIKEALIDATQQMADGELDAEEMKAYSDQLKVIGELIVGTELEKRVEEVEKKVK